MRTVGELLIEARNKKGVGLDQAEKETRIRKKVLRLLEEGSWNKFAPTYAKGLLKNYASYLELDERKVLAFFRREYDEKRQSAVATKKLENIRPRFHFTPTSLTAVLIGGLILIVLSYLFFQYRSFTAAPLLEVNEPKNEARISTLEVNVVGRTLNDSILKINGEQVQVSPGGTFSIVVGLKEGVNNLTITSANRFGKISTVKRTVFVELPKQKESSTGTKSEVLVLELEILKKSTFLEIEVDGKTAFEGLMLVGSSKNFRAETAIKITSEDAGNTKIKVKGKEFILGKEGEKVEREFTLND